MLKPTPPRQTAECKGQPPSGGCVLKLVIAESMIRQRNPAAFRRLCVETLVGMAVAAKQAAQPPSGGCVLKLLNLKPKNGNQEPAAFRRLCVETSLDIRALKNADPAAFRRLCVETLSYQVRAITPPPAAFRRLCVETWVGSAFGLPCTNQPPSGGCVLKQGKFADESQQMSQPPSGGCVLKPSSL